MKLEEQLDRIAYIHDLTSLSINFYRLPDGTFWVGSYAHRGDNVGTGDSASVAADAIKMAIAALNSKMFHAGPWSEELAAMVDDDGKVA